MKNKCPIYEMPKERPPKRLTYHDGRLKGIEGFKDKECYEICDEFSTSCDICPVHKAIIKLVDYEDICNNPEKVKKLIEKNKELQKENKKLKAEIAEMMQYAWYTNLPVVKADKIDEFLNTKESDEQKLKRTQRLEKFSHIVTDNTKE